MRSVKGIEAVCFRYYALSVLLLFSFVPCFCRFLEGSLILNRIWWTMTTKQSCFIPVANDLALSHVIQLAKLKDNLPEKYTSANRYMHELIRTETLVIARIRVQTHSWRELRIHACQSTKCGFQFIPFWRDVFLK